DCCRTRPLQLSRVGTPSRPGAPLTEPDLWASHPALRDTAVPDGLGGGRALVSGVSVVWGGQVMRRQSKAPSAIPVPASAGVGRCRVRREDRHRRQGRPFRGSRLRHRARRRGRPTRIRSAVGPLRAVGCLAKQFELLCLLAGRGRLPSPLLGSGWDRLSPAFRYYATIRLLSSLCHIVLS